MNKAGFVSLTAFLLIFSYALFRNWLILGDAQFLYWQSLQQTLAYLAVLLLGFFSFPDELSEMLLGEKSEWQGYYKMAGISAAFFHFFISLLIFYFSKNIDIELITFNDSQTILFYSSGLILFFLLIWLSIVKKPLAASKGYLAIWPLVLIHIFFAHAESWWPPSDWPYFLSPVSLFIFIDALSVLLVILLNISIKNKN